jgi:phosphoglycerate dehydrogenase-like enzyme
MDLYHRTREVWQFQPMNDHRFKLLYVYEERIPADLRRLVLDTFPVDEFVIDQMTYATSDEERQRKFRWAEGVLFAPGRYLPESVFQDSAHIKLMQLWSSGYDKFNVADARQYGIPVANNGGANAISVAEHTLLLMLAIYKWLSDSHRRTVEGRWEGNSHGMDMFLLHGKTLGVIGFGNIGKHVARRASGFGMKVLYHDPVRAATETEQALGAGYADLETLLSAADIVTLHVHLNESTTGMMGKQEIGLMKESAVLINVSRAQLVDNQALLRALEEGRLWAAGLDVYAEEPTRPNDPLLTHPHVVATPHMAGSTHDAYVVAMSNALDNFRRVRDGQKPLWVVNGVE